MKKIQISVVIPLFNEKESLVQLVGEVRESLEKIPKTFEIIFVDDGSTDESFRELEKIKRSARVAITIIRFRKNEGKSAALEAGFKQASGDIVVTLDADLQDDPQEIKKLLLELDKGYDLVVGWRKNRKDRQNKIRLSRVFNCVVAKISHIPLHDMNCGLKVMKKEVAKEINLYGELHRFIPVLAVSQGFKVSEVEVAHHERKFGRSKYNNARLMHAFFDLITTYFLISFKNRPLQIFGPVGAIFIALGLIVLIYLSGLHFFGATIGRRPLLFLGILFLLFGVQIFSTGLLAELMISLHSKRDKYPIKD